MNKQTVSPRFMFQPDAARGRHVSTLRLVAGLLLALCAFDPISAQSMRLDDGQSRAERAVVVAAATAQGVRFAAPSDMVEMRLEVFSTAGEKVFDTEFRRGSVLDWVGGGDAAGAQGAPPDDEYLFIVTLRDLSERRERERRRQPDGGFEHAAR